MPEQKTTGIIEQIPEDAPGIRWKLLIDFQRKAVKYEYYDFSNLYKMFIHSPKGKMSKFKLCENVI